MQLRPWQHGVSVRTGLGCADPIGARAFQQDGRDSDLVGVKNKTFLKDRPRRTISKKKNDV